MNRLPSGWTQCILRDVTEYVTSGSRDWSKFYSNHGALFVRTENINKNRLSPDDQIARVALPESVEGKRTRIRRDDILITITGANVGKCAHVDREMPEAYVSQSVALVRMKDSRLARFVHRQLITPGSDAERTLLQQMAYGLGRPVLNLDNVRDAPLTIAPQAEQHRIVDRLDALLVRVDACRERLDRVPAILKRFRQAILHAATTGALTEELRLQSQAAIQSPGPPRWSSSTIGAVAIDLRYGTSKKCEYQASGLAVLRIPNIGDYGSISTEDLKRSEFEHSEVERLALREGDLLIIRSNGSVELVGKASVIRNNCVGLLFAGYLMRLRLDTRIALPDYVQLWLAAPSQRRHLELMSKSTSGVNNLNAEELRSVVIDLPVPEEQMEIIQRVQALFALADDLEAKLAKLRAQVERITPALLAMAFRGELVPQDPNDVPASTLLAHLQVKSSEVGRVPTKRRQSPTATTRATV